MNERSLWGPEVREEQFPLMAKLFPTLCKKKQLGLGPGPASFRLVLWKRRRDFETVNGRACVAELY